MRTFFKILLLIILTTLSIDLHAQWKVETTTDDYTMETEHKMYYYEGNCLIAGYSPELETIRIMRLYDGSAYFDEAYDAYINNNGRIDPKTITVFYRIIYPSKEFEEQQESLEFEYGGKGVDFKINTDGFFSMFSLFCPADKLKKANYINFQYYDSISDRIVTQKISLAGFTRCYNLCK